MKRNFIYFFILLIQIPQIIFASDNTSISTRSIDLFDQSRHRAVPVLIYSDKQKTNLSNQKPIVIINHGYTALNSEYSFIANALANEGYYVVSIQHDLTTDQPLPRIGNLYQRRMPLWKRGVENIQFVLKEIKKINPNANTHKIILIGHSNGGDIEMLFATQHPEQVLKIVSLDSLRMPFPKNKHFKILTIRANDTKADDSVLPDQENQRKFSIKVISLKNAKHIDLCDRGSAQIKNEVLTDILNFIR